jgi:hypothetical protein
MRCVEYEFTVWLKMGRCLKVGRIQSMPNLRQAVLSPEDVVREPFGAGLELRYIRKLKCK